MHCSESWLQLSISQTVDGLCSIPLVLLINWPSHHIDDNDELDTRVGEPAISSKTLVNGMEKTQVLIKSFGSGSDVEDVEGGIEDEGHVEFRGFVWWEEGDVQRVVLARVSECCTQSSC